MEKVLIECCLELYANGLVVGIQDLGGAGLSCATSELASAGDGGMRVESFLRNGWARLPVAFHAA